MKTGLHKTYPFKADFYDYIVSQNDDSGQISTTQQLDRTFRCRIVTDGTGRLIIFTRENLRPGGRIMNVRDRNGELIMPGNTTLGVQFVIDTVEPELNVFGMREDWIYACNRQDI